MDDDVCKKLWVKTFEYGNENARTYKSGIRDLPELYLHAINRGIDIDLPTSKICKLISEQIPSVGWQKSAILAMGIRNLVSEEELRLVMDYGSYAYRSINENLRKYPDHDRYPHTINKIINNMPPIDKDIITFRYVATKNFLPTVPDSIFVSHGYLSTTMDAFWVAKGACQSHRYDKDQAIIKLNIPKGTKAIYLSGDESEILLPHNIRLKLINITNQKFMCPLKKNNNGETSCHILDNIPIYEFELL